MIFSGVLPFVTLLYLNLNIIISLRDLRSRLEKSNARRNGTENKILTFIQQNLVEKSKTTLNYATSSKEVNLTVVLLSTVVMFMICHIPR